MRTEGPIHSLEPRRPAANARRRWSLGAGAICTTFLCMTDVLAHATIQRQVDAETGITTYSFRPANSKVVETTEPRAQPRPAPAASLAPVMSAMPVAPAAPAGPPAASTMKPQETSALPVGLISSSRRDYPRVPAEVQKVRDAERRRILKEELAWEEENLAQAIGSKVSGDAVIRYRANIEALNREIRNSQ